MIHTIRQYWKVSRIGATRIEISDHPLVPGEERDYEQRFPVVIVYGNTNLR